MGKIRLQVGVLFFGHAGYDHQLGPYGKIIHAFTSKRTPVSIALTGDTLRAINERQPILKAKLNDPSQFARFASAENPYQPELLVAPYNHINVVPLALEPEHMGTHLMLSGEQSFKSRQLADWHHDVWSRLMSTKDTWRGISGMEFRHPGWVGGFGDHFNNVNNQIIGSLHEIDGNLAQLEAHAYN